MSGLDLLVSFQLTLLLHATVLLSLAWLLERTGALGNPAWAELAWRAALFGALLSASVSVLGPVLREAPPLANVATDAPLTPEVRAARDRVADASAAAAPAPLAVTGDLGQARREAAPDPAAYPDAARHADAARASASGNALAPIPAPVGTTVLTLPVLATVLLWLPWAIGLAFAGTRFALQWRHLRLWSRALAIHDAPPAHAVSEQARALGDQLGLAQLPSLHLVPGLASPMLLPGARLLLPEWVDTLDAPRQRALLAHELAHLQRHDPAWRIAHRLARVPLSVHPLAWLAVRRLDALAEDACDARAAELCGSGRPLAECLAVCLTHAGRRAGHPPLAVAMADDDGQVVRRVRNLLEETPMTRPIPTALRRTALVAALAAAIALPGLAVSSIANDAFADGLFNWGEGSTHIQTNGKDSYRYRHTGKGERIALTMRGRVEFTADESDIAGMDPEASFDFADTREGVKQQLVVTVVDGKLVRDYRVDGEARPLDDEGRAWLAERLPHLVRESGMNAEARGKRLLATGGTPALLDEIDRIDADHARRNYLQVLFANATLDDVQMQRALEAVRGLGSDHERRLALSFALSSHDMSPARQAQLLEVVADIGSDYEQALLLMDLAKRQPLTGPVLAAWRAALESVGSDYEQRRVLDALLARDEPAAARLALESARGIGSDYEARQVLEAAIPLARGDDGVRREWFAVLADIGSDYEQRQALEALVGAGPVDVALATAVLDSIADIGSGHEAAATLRGLAAVMPADPILIERYRAATRRLSDHERGQAEKALDRFASL
ncbi:M56 family metallopeptidase [Arenimonas sp.]|uniref:M56 family metallopeptidase n=1 Tax=Arenimonas sp. TaxID=1872635 RepID=UPI0025BA1237|nr:M56 family metallopeptidase [Arenimonas sp.]